MPVIVLVSLFGIVAGGIAYVDGGTLPLFTNAWALAKTLVTSIFSDDLMATYAALVAIYADRNQRTFDDCRIGTYVRSRLSAIRSRVSLIP